MYVYCSIIEVSEILIGERALSEYSFLCEEIWEDRRFFSTENFALDLSALNKSISR